MKAGGQGTAPLSDSTPPTNAYRREGGVEEGGQGRGVPGNAFVKNKS